MAGGYTKIKGLVEALKNRPGITLKTRIYAGETHLSYYPSLVMDGFSFVLPPLRPSNYKDQILTDAAVAPYVGDYTLPDGRRLTIRHPKLPPAFFTALRPLTHHHKLPPGLPHDALEAQVTGSAPVQLLQNGKDRFYAPASDLNVTFDKSGLTLAGADGGTLRAERLP